MSFLCDIEKNKITVKFTYSPQIVAAIKSVDGRIWNALLKRWEFPVENIEDAYDILLPLGFSFTENFLKKKEEKNKLFEEVKAIAGNPGKYEGVLPLYDFQKIGAAFLNKMPAALLADVPGLGKSIQTIAANEKEELILVFCPATLKYNWKEEIEKWLPGDKVMVIGGNAQKRTEQWDYARNDKRFRWVIANYELLLHDHDQLAKKLWPVIVCDEATRISNPLAKTTKNLKALACGKKIALTGTPISNKPDDIYSIIDWIVPGYLGNFFQFKNKYCESDTWGRVVGYKNIDKLAEKVNRFMLRRTKEEVFDDFPPKTILNLEFELSQPEKELYRSVKELLIDEIEAMSDMDTTYLSMVCVKMLRLKQCTDCPTLVGSLIDSSKLAALKELLEPIIASGEKAIIFTQFSQMLKLLEVELQDYRPLCVYGDVDNVERMERVKEFNDDPKGRVIIMTEAGAYGLNMQSASYVMHYDSPWSIAKLQQREDRAHRIGQKKPVTVYNLIAKGTIDEYVLKILHRKEALSKDILKDAERIAEGRMSKDDIADILKLDGV